LIANPDDILEIAVPLATSLQVFALLYGVKIVAYRPVNKGLVACGYTSKDFIHQQVERVIYD
jgi:hypothetical protein